MKLKTIFIALILGTGLTASAQGTFVFDQQSTGAIDASGSLSSTPFGQSFTPTLDSIGFLDLELFNGASASTLDVNIRSGSITGSILGTSLTTTMPSNSTGIFDFLFSSPITLTPGTQYYFEPVVVSGSFVHAEGTFIQYAGGDLIQSGVALTDRDLWFREGVVNPVPEPASAGLFILAGVLFWKRRKL